MVQLSVTSEFTFSLDIAKLSLELTKFTSVITTTVHLIIQIIRRHCGKKIHFFEEAVSGSLCPGKPNLLSSGEVKAHTSLFCCNLFFL